MSIVPCFDNIPSRFWVFDVQASHAVQEISSQIISSFGKQKATREDDGSYILIVVDVSIKILVPTLALDIPSSALKLRKRIVHRETGEEVDEHTAETLSRTCKATPE